jgi:CheY-like chemotaxis protein
MGMARILIVDDEEMDRVLLSEVLHQAGHEPLFAPNGQSALRIWRSSNIDLVVTDIVMPELDGLGLLEQLREEDPWVRVIAISGVSAKRLNEAARAGAQAILTKPVNPEELVREISRALSESGSWLDVED